MRPLINSTGVDREQKLAKILSARSVIVTRGMAAGDRLGARLSALGVKVIHCPCISFQPPHDEGPIVRAARCVPEFDWLLFTSTNAVHAFSDRVRANALPIPAIRVPVATVGATTADVARAEGWNVAFIPSRSSGETLAIELPLKIGQRILLPRADIASADLPALLRTRGASVSEVVAYRTVDGVTAETIATLRTMPCPDAITFSSPSAVRFMLAAARRANWNMRDAQRLHRLRIVCIGQTTTDEVLHHGLNADSVARDQSVEGLVEALASSLRTPRQVTGEPVPIR